MDNEQLKDCMRRYRDGDETAFDAMFEDLKTPVFTVARRLTQQRETAEDVLQDVFVKLYRDPPDPERIRNPRAYIFQMAHNLALNTLRDSHTESAAEMNENIGRADGAIDRMLTDMELQTAFAALDFDEKEIVTLHIHGDLKFREIADILRKPLGTVLWKYRRALRKLHDTLGAPS